MTVRATPSSAAPELPAAPESRLPQRWLLLVRAAWLIFAAGLLASFIVSIPANYAQLHSVCTDPKAICPSGQPTPGTLLALQRLGLSLDAFAFFNIGINVGLSLVLLGIGTLVFWRRSSDWLGLSVSFSLVLFGALGVFGGLASSLIHPGAPLVLSVFVQIMSNLEVPAIGLFLVIFPTGRFTPRWTWIVVVFWAAQLLVFGLPAPYNINFWLPPLAVADLLLMYGSPIALQVYRYRRVYTPIQQQQAKWLIFGFAGSALLLLLNLLVEGTVPGLGAPDSPFQLLGTVIPAFVFGSIPLAVGMATLRYRLWDIDSIINKALVYGLLTGSLGALYAGLIIGLTSLAGALVGTTEQPVALVISTLAIAALFFPVRRRIQGVIDRRFYRRKYDTEKTLAAFSATLRNETDLEQLCGHLLNVVNETMQPAQVSLWLRPPTQGDQGENHHKEAFRYTAGRNALPTD